jgi:hypothetical protein
MFRRLPTGIKRTDIVDVALDIHLRRYSFYLFEPDPNLSLILSAK